MKFLLVNNLYPPYSRGGAETAVVNEAQALLAAGHEVAVFTTAPYAGWRSLKLSEWKEDGVKVYRFYPLNLFWYRNDGKHNAFVRALWYIGNLWGWHPVSEFKRAVKEFRPDAVHLHNINGISYRLPRLCDRLKLKTVFTVHAVHYAYPSGVILRSKKTPWPFAAFAAFMRHKLRSSARVAAPSRWLLDFYLSKGFFKDQKTAVIPNPLSAQFSDPESQIPSGEPKNASQKPAIKFLYVGQLEAYKGLNVMLAALKRLPPELEWRLEIVGDGPMMNNLRRERDSRVTLRGRLQGDDVVSAYRSASALIMPSLCEENSPMVIAEANAQGLPVIASSIGGIPEMVVEGKNGFLFEPGNVEELAMHCRRFIEHPEIRESLRPSCLEISRKYAPSQAAGEYLKLLSR